MTKQEQHLENVIAYCSKRLVEATTPTAKQHAWNALKKYHAQRSHERIAAMERERNLV